jgi:transposase
LSEIKSGTAANLKTLRKVVINEENFKTENKWMLEYNYDLRDEALQDLLKNIKSNQAKEKKFEMKYKCKKNKQSLSVLSKKWNNKNDFYSSVFNSTKLKSSEELPIKLMYTSRLVKTPTNKYYLCIPKPLEFKSENQAHKMVFVDPGSNDFVTLYDPSGNIVVWGEKDSGRIARLLHYKRRLQSKISKEKQNKKKQRMNIALLKIGENIHNLVSEMHKKLAKWMCMTYSKIYIPRLNFHTCKNLSKKAKATLASLRHCDFVNRLIHKSKEYKCEITEVNEAFTSKTCGNCGFQKENLGRSRRYECDSCQVKIGRDINASRNVMLRYFTKTAKLILV